MKPNLVQVHNPKGNWVLIDRERGLILDSRRQAFGGAKVVKRKGTQNED